MKNFIIGSGWKMMLGYLDSIAAAAELTRKLEGFHDFPVVIFPSFPAIPAITEAIPEESVLKAGGQDMFWEEAGAYTGEVSGRMLLEIGCRYVEINHQERRRFLKEGNEMANWKLKTALRIGLTPFLCVGEERAGTRAEAAAFIRYQLSVLLKGVESCQAGRIVYAYEPMWAIGRKTSAGSAHIQSIHEDIRSYLRELYGEVAAAEARIVYGGGIRMDTYLEIAALPDVNGLFTTGCGTCPDTYSELILTTARLIGRSD